jgi:hypothetical protein
MSLVTTLNGGWLLETAVGRRSIAQINDALKFHEPDPHTATFPMLARVWHIPQLPGKPFYVPVQSLEEALRVMKTLALYDKFQIDNNIKGDYANMQGLQAWYEDPEEGGRYLEWNDEQTGEDINDYRNNLKATS